MPAAVVAAAFEHVEEAREVGVRIGVRIDERMPQAGVRHSLVDPHTYADANLTGFLNVLEGCRHHGCRHLVYASSSSVYGGNTRVPFNSSDNVDHPLSLYGATKKANELMA